MIDSSGNEKRHSPERMDRSLQQIVSQHGNILSLRHGLERAVRRADMDAIERGLLQLSGAIEAHFELEEGAYYPPAVPVESAAGDTLLSLVDEHERLRTELRTLGSLLSDGREKDFGRALEAFSSALTDHEVREEKAMRDLASLR
jgi:hemerythrin